MSSSRKSTPISTNNNNSNNSTNGDSRSNESSLRDIKTEPQSGNGDIKSIALINSNFKFLPDNYKSINSCLHLDQVLESRAKDTVFDTYKQAVIISQPILNTTIYKLKKDDSLINHDKIMNKKISSLKCSDCSKSNFQQVMICLQCPHVGCEEHSFLHYKGTQHMFAIDSKFGLLFCFKCNNYINHPELEKIRYKIIKNNDDEINEIYEDNDTKSKIQIDENYTEPNKLSILGLKGFVNLGATCFMSSILQTFIHNPIIKTQFFNNDLHYFNCEHLKNQEINGYIGEENACITCSIDLIFKNFYNVENNEGFGMTNLLTTAWYKHKSLAGFQEQDAHEFWQFLLNELHQDYQRVLVTQKQNDLNHTTNGNGNIKIEDKMNIDEEEPATEQCKCITHSTFSFELQSCVKCNSCNSITETVDPMIDLSLEINHLVQKHNKKINLYDCLNLFTQEEKLDSPIKCKFCFKKSKATKTLKLKNLSPILSIQLKRFNHNIVSDTSSKIETPVEIPLYLNLQKYLTTKEEQSQNENQFFELFSVVCHIGSVNTGHYIVYIKNFQNLWFKFDDSVISIVDQMNVLNSNAYLLYYIVHNL
ncbi:hypothetical protein KGF54_003156 [Candida jiufengensis]|uniref:uncharacterized protein n=1 Tax=Candida jiufengensis TaxID=497108 RepID=UPI002224B4FF|nr:uncharacterized protein KGF54_003156 [Candida jiufengensis]KAI5952290.1 hypothetical protein KGF54_003156 [Candida jiufengensis]